jgi:hypothetical protein
VIICPQVDQDELVGTATCFGTAPSTLDADPDNDDPTGTTYEWWFNNENVGTSKTLTLSVSDFPRPGSFTVEVRKTTNCQVYIETATIEIEKPEPVDFSFSRPQKQPFRSSSF